MAADMRWSKCTSLPESIIWTTSQDDSTITLYDHLRTWVVWMVPFSWRNKPSSSPSRTFSLLLPSSWNSRATCAEALQRICMRPWGYHKGQSIRQSAVDLLAEVHLMFCARSFACKVNTREGNGLATHQNMAFLAVVQKTEEHRSQKLHHRSQWCFLFLALTPVSQIESRLSGGALHAFRWYRS